MSVTPLTAALVISTRQLWEQAHACIQNLPVRIALEESDPSNADALLDRIERHRADVVLIETGKLALPFDEFVERLRASASQPVVFVLAAEPSPEQILAAMRAGAREFLHAPLQEPLKEALERLSAQRARSGAATAGGLGRIMGFVSARGGCGASTVVTHVAVNASKRMDRKMLLADFDFDAGIIRFLLKLRNSWAVSDAISNLHRMDSSLWEALISKYNDKLDAIPAPEDLTAKHPAGPQETAHLMRFLRSAYPLVFVDFGRHFSTTAMNALPELDTLYIVTTLEPETLDSAAECARMALDRGLGALRVKAVLNRLPERNAPDAAQIEKQVGIPVACTLSSDFLTLHDCWSEGRLLDTGSQLGKELASFAASIVSEVKGEKPVTAKEPERAGTPGFRKFFSMFQRQAVQG
jgi:pilus assembly protein CpaE